MKFIPKNSKDVIKDPVSHSSIQIVSFVSRAYQGMYSATNTGKLAEFSIITTKKNPTPTCIYSFGENSRKIKVIASSLIVIILNHLLHLLSHLSSPHVISPPFHVNLT